MKVSFLVMALATLFLISRCNNSRKAPPQDHAGQQSVDSSKPTELQIIFNVHYPIGGKFSGHPGIREDGYVNLELLAKDPVVKKAKGLVRVYYTYEKGGRSFRTWKDITFGLPNTK